MFRLLAICCVVLFALSACAKSVEQAERIPVEKPEVETNAIDIKARASDTGSDYVDVGSVKEPVMPDFGPETTTMGTGAPSSSEDYKDYYPKGTWANDNVEVFPID